jgi:hypothetical protein
VLLFAGRQPLVSAGNGGSQRSRVCRGQRPKQLSAPTYGINMLLSFSELCGISLIGGETAALLYGWSRQAARRRKLNVAVWNLTQARVFGLKAEAAASISTRQASLVIPTHGPTWVPSHQFLCDIKLPRPESSAAPNCWGFLAPAVCLLWQGFARGNQGPRADSWALLRWTPCLQPTTHP